MHFKQLKPFNRASDEGEGWIAVETEPTEGKKEGSAYLSGKNPLVSTVCWQPRKRVRGSDENRVKIRSVAIRSYPLPTLCTIAREKCLTVTKPNLNIYRMYDRPTLKPVGKENIQF